MIDPTVPTNSNSSLDDILSELETQFGSSPTHKGNSTQSFQKKSSFNEFPSFKKPLLAIIALVILVVGTGVAVFMSNTVQDLRQQAAEEGGTATLALKPGSQSGIQSGSQTSLDLVANAGADVEIVGIQLVADINGVIPTDLHFAPETIPNLNLVVNTLEDTQNGKRLTVAYLTDPPASYAATSVDLKIGAIEFTAQTGEDFTVAFDNTLTKIVRKGDSQDILQPGETYTYSTIADATVAPTQTNTPTPANTATPTPTPGQGGGISPSPTEVVVPLETSTPTPVSTSAPTATQALGGLCVSASVVNPNRGNGEATRIGDTINIVCGEVITAQRYEFRIQNPSGMIDTLQPISTGARQSQPYQITTSGKYHMQCRICTDDAASSCSAWEPTNQ